jgi:uncharacterized protein with FMN-binding domain
MGFKRPIMIAGGTVSAVAAVLGYHPAQSSTGLLTSSAPLGSATAGNQQGAATPSASTTTATQTPSAPSSSSSPTASATKKNKSTKSSQSSTNSGAAANATAGNTQPSPQPSASQSQAPTETTTPPPAPAPAPTKTVSASQTITGPVISTRWGPVQVEIVVENGQIVGATGLQYPSGDRRSLYISEQAVPMLVELTLQAQSADGIPRIGGATYTSNGWKSSLAAALKKI